MINIAILLACLKGAIAATDKTFVAGYSSPVATAPGAMPSAPQRQLQRTESSPSTAHMQDALEAALSHSLLWLGLVVVVAVLFFVLLAPLLAVCFRPTTQQIGRKQDSGLDTSTHDDDASTTTSSPPRDLERGQGSPSPTGFVVQLCPYNEVNTPKMEETSWVSNPDEVSYVSATPSELGLTVSSTSERLLSLSFGVEESCSNDPAVDNGALGGQTPKCKVLLDPQSRQT
ncbi:Aste57867_12192 [Aphanomyces stellatus]|uniref:Aste57867_12192 protein n=1 Tax=Aphanomyces stellatus TaxID=120398 RepID=A0A485KUX3_9STRA|nr:hypothetical protein As57867_012147 [Aphanomyces stellatus]VFT89046.1 Aste57867_12192 [Aphanomyces stellatus]